MINFDDYVNENKTEHNLKWTYIPDHPYRILIIPSRHEMSLRCLKQTPLRGTSQTPLRNISKETCFWRPL